MTYNVVTQDPTIDQAITTALMALSEMVLEALDAYGLGQSVALGADVPDVSPESGPFAVHTLASDERAIEVLSFCEVRIEVRVHSWYLVAPIQAERAEALSESADWVIPVIRAMLKNTTLGGLVERCLPVGWRAFGAAQWGGSEYTGVLVVSDINIVQDMDLED